MLNFKFKNLSIHVSHREGKRSHALLLLETLWLSAVTKPLLSFSRFLLCAGEHKRHRLSAICIPGTHEANLHKSQAMMYALKEMHGSLADAAIYWCRVCSVCMLKSEKLIYKKNIILFK